MTETGAQTRWIEHAKNVYSQNGDDGILGALLDRLPARDNWCVEFGAWDGIYFSNTRHLIESRGYAAVLIEPDLARYADLQRNCAGRPRIWTFNQFVGLTTNESLDHVLKQTPIPRDFDLLTLDIEGNDHHAWAAISAYQPKIVHLPFNPTIPTAVDYTQPCDPSVTHGPSLKALVRLGREKGYELVCVNYNTAFFVRAVDFPRFGVIDNSPERVREDHSAVTWLWTGYDGSIHVTGRDMLLHHRGMRVSRRLRQLPKVFQSYPHNWRRWRQRLFGLYWRVVRAVGRA